MNTQQLEPELRRVPIGLIDPPRDRSRVDVDEAHVEELAADMRVNGFTSAVILARNGDRYEVIGGEHRFLAAPRAGIPAIPALVYPTYEAGYEAIQASENELQLPTTAADQAIHYQRLLERRPEDGTDGVAARVKRSRDFVEQRLALLHGDEEIFGALAAKLIPIGVAEQFNKVTDQVHRRYLLDLALRQGGVTVAIACAWVREWREVHAPALRNAPAAGANDPTRPVADEPFTCALCGLHDNTPRFQTLWVHDYCVPATLKPALAFFRARGDTVAFPSTLEDAYALITRIIERFPQIGAQEPAQP